MGGIGIVVMIVLRIYGWVMMTAVRLIVWLGGKALLLFRKLGAFLAAAGGAAAIVLREFGGWLVRRWAEKRRAWKNERRRKDYGEKRKGTGRR